MVLVALGFVLLLLGVAEVGDRTALAAAAAVLGVLAALALLLGVWRSRRPPGLPEEPAPWAGAQDAGEPAPAAPADAAAGRDASGTAPAAPVAADPSGGPEAGPGLAAPSPDHEVEEAREAQAYARALAGVCGPARQRLLLERYGTLEALRSADAGELAAIPGIDRVRAEAIQARLQRSLHEPAAEASHEPAAEAAQEPAGGQDRPEGG